MTYSAEVLTDTPLGYWRLGDSSGTTMADSSGNSRDGTYTGSPTLAAAGLLGGDADTAVTFNGSSQYGTVTYASWMDLSTFTVEAVVKATSYGSVNAIADRRGGAGFANQAWEFVFQDGKLNFYIMNGSSFTNYRCTKRFIPGVVYHVAVTVSASLVKMYVNGVEEYSGTRVAAPNTISSNLLIAASESPIVGHFAGTVDEVAIYSGDLSGARIAVHAAATNKIPLAVNLVPNPNLETDAATYAPTGNCTVTRSTTWANTGSGSLRIDPTGAGSYVAIDGDSTGTVMQLGMAAGRTYTAAGTINTPVAQTGTLSSEARQIVAYVLTPGGYIAYPSSAGPSTGVARVSVTFTVPTDATQAFIRLNNGSPNSGSYVYWDDIQLIEESTLTDYFDGDTTDAAGVVYDWAGTARNSPSTAIGNRLPNTTGTAPVTVGSSSSTTAPAVTTGTAAVTVASSSATVGAVTTTGTAPVTVSSSATTVLLPGALATWTSDLSQQAVVEFTSPAAILLVNPPAAEAPATIVERTILRNSIMLDPMTVDTDTGRVDPASFDATVTGEVGVYHATVDGVDVTYWRDAPTVIGQMHFSEPGGEDSARLEFPQITSIDEAGTGDLAWLHTDAPVEIFILTPEGDRIHKFSGHLVSDNTGIGTALKSTWDVQGNIRQSDSIVHRVPTILDPTDIGILVPKYLNDVPGRRYASIAPTTTTVPPSKHRGSYSDTEWDYAQTLLGSAHELDGDQWTLTRNGINQYAVALKDRSTVHWTVTAGTPGVEFDLTEDVASLVNCIYGRGVGPDGYAWAGWCHPNLLPDDAPDYPMFPITDLIEVGTVDADTSTGNGVTTWQRRVQSLGYSITVDGVYSSSDAVVCRQVQTDYGLLVDGKVGPQTWAATFDTGSGGGDLNGSYRRPLAVISAVDPNLYAANGAIVGANPEYDPSIIRRERNIDYGTGITKAEATVLAQMELARDSVTGWQGSITFKVDPREGSRHLMREGQNILLQGFRGGDVLLHISELSADPSDDYMPVTVTVDSKARDAMSLSSIAQRDRDAKADPVRRPGNPSRRSRQEQDMAVEYDGESGAGVIPHFPVYGGLWSVIRIPVSEVGNVKLTLATTSGPACEFSIGFFGLPLTPAHMNSLVGNPFAAGAWDTNAEVMDEQYAFLESFGNETQACGYYPGGTTLTGRLKDTGSWEYISGKPPHIWVAIYAESTCFIEGRVYPAPVV